MRVGLVCRVVVVVCATVVMAVVPAAAGARVAIGDGGAGHQAASASLLEVPGPGTVEDRKAKPEAAKSPELLSATATKVEGTPDAGAWQRAESITGFLQRDPHERAPPSCQTEHLGYYVNTDTRTAVAGTWQGFVFRDEAGASAWGLDPEITCRPATFVAIRAGLHVEKVNEDTQSVENVAGLRAFMPRSHGVNRQPGVCGTLRSGRGKWRQETV